MVCVRYATVSKTPLSAPLRCNDKPSMTWHWLTACYDSHEKERACDVADERYDPFDRKIDQAHSAVKESSYHELRDLSFRLLSWRIGSIPSHCLWIDLHRSCFSQPIIAYEYLWKVRLIQARSWRAQLEKPKAPTVLIKPGAFVWYWTNEVTWQDSSVAKGHAFSTYSGCCPSTQGYCTAVVIHWSIPSVTSTLTISIASPKPSKVPAIKELK